MDLSKIDTKQAATEGRKMELFGPDGMHVLKDDTAADLPENRVTITLLGKDSDAFVARTNAITDRRIQHVGRQKMTAEQAQKDGVKLLATCTLAWDGVEVDGEELPCNLENAIDLYTRFSWIREQVDTFIGERENFLPASQTI